MKRNEVRRPRYGVVGCYRCKNWQVVELGHKTHICAYCTKLFLLRKASVIFSNDSQSIAAEFLRAFNKKGISQTM